MFDTFVLKLTNLYKKLFKKPEPIKEPLGKISRASEGQVEGRYDFSTMDCTPLSKNTIELIEYFEKGIKNSETPKIGGNFDNEGKVSKKLTRYETYINFLIKHTYDEKMPTDKFVIENCKYENVLVFTPKIIRSHKKEGVEKGDFIQEGDSKHTLRHILIRKEKY
jgi:hypothetical protein